MHEILCRCNHSNFLFAFSINVDKHSFQPEYFMQSCMRLSVVVVREREDDFAMNFSLWTYL